MAYRKGENIRDFYRLEEELGRGSFAVVCRAISIQSGEQVAIKILEK